MKKRILHILLWLLATPSLAAGPMDVQPSAAYFAPGETLEFTASTDNLRAIANGTSQFQARLLTPNGVAHQQWLCVPFDSLPNQTYRLDLPKHLAMGTYRLVLGPEPQTGVKITIRPLPHDVLQAQRAFITNAHGIIGSFTLVARSNAPVELVGGLKNRTASLGLPVNEGPDSSLRFEDTQLRVQMTSHGPILRSAHPEHNVVMSESITIDGPSTHLQGLYRGHIVNRPTETVTAFIDAEGLVTVGGDGVGEYIHGVVSAEHHLFSAPSGESGRVLWDPTDQTMRLDLELQKGPAILTLQTGCGRVPACVPDTP